MARIQPFQRSNERSEWGDHPVWLSGSHTNIRRSRYASFLATVYDNIKNFWETDEKSGLDKYVLADLDKIECIEDGLRELEREGKKIRVRDNKEMDKAYREKEIEREQNAREMGNNPWGGKDGTYSGEYYGISLRV
eukprot:COSAG06_NODE_215_length_20124_cov_3.931735_20_plen_136_part_00